MRSVADDLPAVEWIGRHGMWVAPAAWALAFVAMVVHLARTLVCPRPVAAESWPLGKS
ncbi:hypothetical protein [Actinomadura mexicana]|uniref:Uncharacterized protein n=1 Tax=Actinomadura mexicana TaxID=134959 RepID=A0A239AX23_9ACTN|nr:hypothetical protein [Actinomadura mexicana]SNR99528.1 hypothetical protein SAMN06265355_109230 [Actinomadura mexicana]